MFPQLDPTIFYEMVHDIQLADVDEYEVYANEMAATIHTVIGSMFGKEELTTMVTTNEDTLLETINTMSNANSVELSNSQKTTLVKFMSDVGKKVLDKVNNEI